MDLLGNAAGLDVPDVFKGCAAGKEVMSLMVKKFGAQGAQDAHAGITSRRAPQAQHDVAAAALHGVSHQQSRAQRGGSHHVA